MGYFPVPVQDELLTYGEAYFQKYVGYARTERGRQLLDFRMDRLGSVWLPGYRVLDVGIGCGSFVEKCREIGICCDGDDVNPSGLAWLMEKGWRAGTEPYHVLTFWDSLEHTLDPAAELKQAVTWAIVSLPICEDREAWLRSRHYREDEHRWYWNRRGFADFAGRCGFSVHDVSDGESRLGRDSILTFTLRRESV